MNFFFGASTSSHQVEGGNQNDWTEWEKKDAKRLAQRAAGRRASGKSWPDFILNGYPNPLQEENYISGKACDHYHRFREDFDIAKALGYNAHRFSIEWSRVEPEEGKFDEKEIEHYRDVIHTLRERGMEPFLTIWHYTLPLWLANKGGLSDKQFPFYFARYTEKLTSAFRDDVWFWITINEPEIFINRPPTKRSRLLFWPSMNRLALAHEKARAAIKKISPEANVGAAMCIVYFDSAGGWINDFLKYIADRAGNFYFLNRIRRVTDFIGLNYYFRNRIHYGFNKNQNAEANDFGWEIFPEGISHVLKDLQKYNLPIYITENGLADSRDTKRSSFVEKHLAWIREAMRAGADVRGYFHWSLLDNFEWDSGFWPRFGLVEIDYKTLERRIRPSALVYKKIIENWGR
jgi:beta-glucosidase